MKPIKVISSLLLTIGAALMISTAFGWSFPIVLSVVFLITLIPVNPGTVLRTVVSNPLIGRAKQSMGGVTFSTWKGINVLKNKATTVANPRSGSQLAQRSAFTQMVALFRSMPAAVRAGFKKLAVQKSEFNAFASANLDNAWDMTAPPDAEFLPANLIVSKGTIAASPISTIVVDRSANTILVTFPTTAPQPGQSVTDLAIIAAYDESENLSTGATTSAARSTGTASIPLPADWATGDTVFVYLGFYNALSGESSDSQNTSGTIVA